MTWRAPDTSPEVWERDHGTDGHATDHPNPKVYAMRAGTEVHALRLTPATGPAVMAWVREHGAQCLPARDGVVILRRGGRPLHAYAGDWLVHTPGGFVVAPPRIAEGLFEPRPAAVPAPDCVADWVATRDSTGGD